MDTVYPFEEIFTRYSIEELVKIWSILGGVPFRLLKMNPNASVEKNIKEKLFIKGGVLYNEPMIVLREEFREPRTYMLILKYLSLGYNTQGKLSSATGIEKGNLSKYLGVMESLDIISYQLPLGKRKGGIYEINDRFFDFWFRFVYPNLPDLELGLVDEVFKKISDKLNMYYGKAFEILARNLIRERVINVGTTPSRVSRWWHKDIEIDIVVEEKGKKVVLGECKWKTNISPSKITTSLKNYSSIFEAMGFKISGYFIFAKSFRKTISEIDGKIVRCFDLKHLEEAAGYLTKPW